VELIFLRLSIFKEEYVDTYSTEFQWTDIENLYVKQCARYNNVQSIYYKYTVIILYNIDYSRNIN